MINSFPYTSFIFLTILLVVLSFFLLRNVLFFWQSCAVVFIKFLIPVIYFIFFYQTSVWTILDDRTYYEVAKKIAQFFPSANSISLIFDPNVHVRAFALINGNPGWGYYWWCYTVQSIFGEYYFVPVLFNIFLSFVAGCFLVKIVRAVYSDNSPQFERFILIFYVLSWDVLSWTSFLNIKDTVVMTCAMYLSYGSIKLIQKRLAWRDVLFLVLVAFLLWHIRFYTVLTIVPCFIFIYLFSSVRTLAGLIKVGLLAIVALCGAFFLLPGYVERLVHSITFSGHSLGLSVVYEALRLFITPLPWNIVPNYSFLLISSWLNLLTYPIFICAVIYTIVKTRTKEYAFILLYFALSVLPYMLVVGEAGPRHVYQFAWFKVFFISTFLYSKLLKRRV